jgi:hypothetical protein
MVLFGKADLQGAYDLFDKAAEMVPIKVGTQGGREVLRIRGLL